MSGLIGCAALSFLLVGLYRWLALHYRWLDHPNQRSSHTRVTPRGAGIVFAVLMLGAASWRLRAEWAWQCAVLAGAIVAAVGWRDDMRGVSARVRFVLYGLSAVAAVALIFTARSVTTDAGIAIAMPWFYAALAALGLLWLINLYNFMDGINGIAAGEALFVLLAVSVLAGDSRYAQIFAPLHLYSCAALTGFLLWNFPLGRVFMGDAGSAFLGFFLGVLMLWSAQLQGPPLAVWLILLGIFVVDSGYTLLVRMATGQVWHAAHRLHAYQLLTTRFGGSHVRTVATVLAVNLGWLLPLAWLVQHRQLEQWWGVGLAYLPLLAACFWLKAGIPVKAGV